MEGVFLKLLNMSITASWIVVAVMILRLILKRAPKAVFCIMWIAVAVRLIFPISLESMLSLIPSAETAPSDMIYSPSPSIQSGIPIIDSALNPVISEYLTPNLYESINPMQVLNAVASVVWVAGVIAMLIYTAISYIRVKISVREAVPFKDGAFLCDGLSTPFILGIIRPKIYIPSDMEEKDIEYVMAHEKAHLRRKDHLWKPFGFLLLAVYWFNPVLWVAYFFLCRDIEAACDEKVIKEMGSEIKKSYSEALINCSAPRRSLAACPLAFGETGVKGRIKMILNYKKPAFWVIILSIVACIVVGVCFLTNPKADGKKEITLYLAPDTPYAAAFEKDCFYAFDESGEWCYRVMWEDREGLYEECEMKIKYSEINKIEYPEGFLDGGYIPWYEVKATSVEVIEREREPVDVKVGHSKYSNQSGEAALSNDDAWFMFDLLKDDFKWSEGITRTMCYFWFEIDGALLSYADNAGLFNDYENDRHIIVSKESREKINAIIAKYLYGTSTELKETEIIFYPRDVVEGELVEFEASAYRYAWFNAEERARFEELMDRSNWNFNVAIDRLPFSFCAKIWYESDEYTGWVSYSREQKVLCYDEYYTEISGDDVVMFKKIEERAVSYPDADVNAVSKWVRYVKDGNYWDGPYFALDMESKTFMASESALMSFAISGDYRIENGQLILDGGSVKFVFDIVDDEYKYNSSDSEGDVDWFKQGDVFKQLTEKDYNEITWVTVQFVGTREQHWLLNYEADEIFRIFSTGEWVEGRPECDYKCEFESGRFSIFYCDCKNVYLSTLDRSRKLTDKEYETVKAIVEKYEKYSSEKDDGNLPSTTKTNEAIVAEIKDDHTIIVMRNGEDGYIHCDVEEFKNAELYTFGVDSAVGLQVGDVITITHSGFFAEGEYAPIGKALSVALVSHIDANVVEHNCKKETVYTSYIGKDGLVYHHKYCGCSWCDYENYIGTIRCGFSDYKLYCECGAEVVPPRT